ncbi:hypothetical protein [Pseudacidovorax intermedius]|uniref:Lipoprotein n=1 Tax=Pseudacidovorax intermedius TaxID=433924 RepID=A0A370F8R5_9BURK|nr:hypothetical protein [Pseudacidovorax intermedius]RDI19121.1 hypothetical protein DFR41_113103 [Pseudacidovorax intermedius]
MRNGNPRRTAGLKWAIGLGCVLALAACGGGGGGGGGGFFLPPAAAPQAPQLAVVADGTTVAAEGDAYVVKPGQVITVKSNQTVSWSGSSPSGKVTAVGTSSSDQQWQARLANANPGATEDYPLVATANSGQTTTVRLKVRAGDSRNGQYMAYVSNGSRQQLKADFDLGSLEFVDTSGASNVGTLVKPASGSAVYGLLSNRETTAQRISGLQVLPDTLVGSFPFPVLGANPVTYAPFLFVATRALITTAADLDGTYNRFRVNYSSNGAVKDSAISQVQFSGAGAFFVRCNEVAITRVDICPTGSLSTATLAPDPTTPGLWRVTNSSGVYEGRVGVARVGNEKMLILAGPGATDPTTAQFSVGLQEQPGWSAFNNAFGWSILGTQDQSTADLSTYTLRSASAAGVVQTALTLNTLGSVGPTGMMGSSTGDGRYYFVARSAQLEMVIGARGNTATAGFFHLGVISN